MAEKILNTRIQLKYDSFTNWKTNNPELLAGEVAIAYLGETQTTTTPDNGTHPVMFKVGPGNFNDLPWSSALAADVYAWAKKARGESTDIDYTKTIKEVVDGEVVSTTTTTITVQNAIDALYSAIETLSGDAGSSIADLMALINKNKDDITDIVEEIGVASVGDEAATGLYAAIEAAQAKADAAYVLPDGGIEGDLSASVKESLALANTAIQDISHLATTETVNGIDERVGVIEADYLKTADKTELEGKITTAETNAKAYADEIKSELLGDDLADTFNTLKDVQEWVNTHGVEATKLATALADETKAREDADTDFETRVSALEEKVDVEKVSDEIAAAEGRAATDAQNKADAAKGAAIEAAAADATTKAGTAKSEAIAAAAEDATTKANAAEAAAKSHAETKAAEAKEAAIADAASKYQEKGDYLTEITTTAGEGLKVTDKNKIDIDTDVVFIFNCGSSSVNV